MYTVSYIRSTTSGGGSEEGLTYPIWKIEKDYLILEKRTLFVCIYGLNFHLKCTFQSILEKK